MYLSFLQGALVAAFLIFLGMLIDEPDYDEAGHYVPLRKRVRSVLERILHI